MEWITVDKAFERIENMKPVFLGQKMMKLYPGEPEFAGGFFYGDETGKITGEGYFIHGKCCAISMKIENGTSIKKAGGRHMIKIYDNIFGIKRKSRIPYWERPIINEGN